MFRQQIKRRPKKFTTKNSSYFGVSLPTKICISQRNKVCDVQNKTILFCSVYFRNFKITLLWLYFLLSIFIFNCRYETKVEPNTNSDNLSKPLLISSKNKLTSNGIYNEPVVKPSRVKSIVNYRSDKTEVPTIQKPVRGVVEQNESLETAGNFENWYHSLFMSILRRSNIFPTLTDNMTFSDFI